MAKDLRKDYRTVLGDSFSKEMIIKIGNAELVYEKAEWDVGGKVTGLRYGENPGQQAALYRLKNGNLELGDVRTIQPGQWLASNAELLQSGKHPGKTNITDADNALNILRYFMDEPVVAIMKHNNPCGVAMGDNLADAYIRANMADRVAAFGGAIALNRMVDKTTAEAIIENYSEVVVAPEFEKGVMDIFAKKKNLRVMEIRNMHRLRDWVGQPVLDFKSLIDGGVIVQTSYVPQARTLDDIKALPLGYFTKKGGKKYCIERTPTEQEYRDMWFGWLVESGITSNSVIYVKDGVTVGIGTGEQDRVGVAKIARDKAYEKARDRVCFERHKKSFNDLVLEIEKEEDAFKKAELESQRNIIEAEVKENHAGLEGAVMVSDAFFPFSDGVYVGLREGVRAIIQPGGSDRDFESIEACNEFVATMVFTGQRSFRH
ncbi:IMP cyclohydrolase [Candidatus Woesearchaeota archaeon]|nr:IMP cyclohydrolase [Candidatus Woesearchaeota archaeon]